MDTSPASQTDPGTQRPSKQFTIKHLIVITALFCVLFSICNWIGMEAVASLVTLSSVFAPTLSFVAACVPEKRDFPIRVLIAASVSVGFLVSCSLVLVASGGHQMIIPVLVGTLCFWSAQWLFLYVLYVTWKSGMRSAEMAEKTLRRNSAHHRADQETQ